MKTTTLATVAVLATTTLAQAGVIFSDDFNRPDSDTVGNNWIEDEVIAPDRVSLGGGAALISNIGGTAGMAQQLDLTGMSSVSVTFDYAAALTPGGVLRLLVGNGNLVTVIGLFPLLSTDLTHVVVDVPTASPVNANQLLWQRWGGNEGDGIALVDNVVIGDVPEPATLAIMVIGLLGLGAMRRRRSSAHVDVDNFVVSLRTQ